MNYRIDLLAASRGYDRQTCWTQARVGVIPATVAGHNPTVVMTMQKLRLNGSDDYEAIHSLHSTDLGQSWSTPVAQDAFARERLQGDDGEFYERAVADFSPKWHASTGKLLGTGHTAYYAGGGLMKDRPRETPYSVYDPQTEQWGRWKALAMPDKEKFFNSGAGCTQRVDLENGEILLPIYFKIGNPYQLATTVVRCGFDGETLEYIEHGTELTTAVPRGFGEPSLARHQGRFFLTLRNDEAGFVAMSDDGLHYEEPQLWRFDDGEELGNYNTQQHWVTHRDDLFLVYSRRGLNNDHVFRHRAPLVMAQVDPERLCVLRETERVVIPERGARLGNFGITQISADEAWVTETEWMQNSGIWAETMLQKLREKLPEEEVERLAATPHLCAACEQFGSDNTVWTARLLW
jgi:hypothetical protein